MAVNRVLLIFFGLLLICQRYQGREVNKAQQYNPNVDFLSHESGIPQANDKKDPIAQNPQFTNFDFPPLKPLNGNTDANGKRDYVAPQRTTSKPVISSTNSQDDSKSRGSTINSLNSADFPPLGTSTQKPASDKRDYVAPNWPKNPPLSPPASSTPLNTQKPPVTDGKRDYVNPNWPGLPTKPTPATTKSSTTTQTQKPPVTDGKRDYVNPNWPGLPTKPTSATTKSSITTQTSKTPSFSSVLAGGNIPNSTPAPVVPRRTTVLPSSLLNTTQSYNKNEPSDAELIRLSEELLGKDSNNAFNQITINYQRKTTSQSKQDEAPLPLFVVPNKVWNIPTIQKFLPLLDNYEWDTLINEHVSSNERIEENAFMDAIMSTSVIRHLMTFLRDKGYVTPDPKQQRDFLKQLWFTLYSRGKGKISSSGFEHVFVSELKNNQVSGAHNWIYFAKQEALNGVNYLGYLKLVEFNNKGAVLKHHFTQQNYDKPVGTMFVGTSPELEMALYTLCFVTRADKDCSLKLGGKDVRIVSHTFRYRSKNLIGSAYPQI